MIAQLIHEFCSCNNQVYHKSAHQSTYTALALSCYQVCHSKTFSAGSCKRLSPILTAMSSNYVCFPQGSAFLAVPFPFWSVLRRQANTVKVEPFNAAVLIVTSNHLSKRNTLTIAIDWFIGVHWRRDARRHSCSFKHITFVYMLLHESPSSWRKERCINLYL